MPLDTAPPRLLPLRTAFCENVQNSRDPRRGARGRAVYSPTPPWGGGVSGRFGSWSSVGRSRCGRWSVGQPCVAETAIIDWSETNEEELLNATLKNEYSEANNQRCIRREWWRGSWG